MAVARIRRTLRGRLVRYATPESDIDGAEVILGELLANVARHAPGAVSLQIDWEGVRPTLVVTDNGNGFPTIPQTTLSDLDAERGRGLALVRALSVETVIGNRLEGGAYVRVILPVRRHTVD
jgi:anti-sigma regulatory factor (Ser/Thr protein kinase)